MVSSAATSVSQYLAELPAERRAVIARVLDTVRRHLPEGYAESMGWGMIVWGIPLARYPDTYNGQPLCYAALAAQKNHYALYLNCLYSDEAQAHWFADAFARAGKRLDMGKSCVRFKRVDDLPLDVIGEAIARSTPDEYIGIYERARSGASRPAARKAATKQATKQATKKATKKSPSKKAPTRKAPAKTASAKKVATRRRA